MQERYPRKQLNDNAIFFGISYEDIAGVSVVFASIMLVNNIFFKNIGGGYLSLIISGFVLSGLIPIRLLFRRKIIRDFIRAFFQRRQIYAPTHFRN